LAAFVGLGQAFRYRATVANAGPLDSDGAVVTTALDAGLANTTWTCTATGDASCLAAGSGDLNATIDLPVSGQAEFVIEAELIDGGPDETVTSSTTITAPANPPDPNPANNSDQATNRTGIFADGFEEKKRRPPGPPFSSLRSLVRRSENLFVGARPAGDSSCPTKNLASTARSYENRWNPNPVGAYPAGDS